MTSADSARSSPGSAPSPAPSPSQRLKQRGKKLLLLSGLLLPLAGGAAWFYWNFFRGASTGILELPVVELEPTTLEQIISESGTVSLGAQQELKSPGEVTVDRVLVQVGDRVSQGQELIRLRSRDPGQSSLAEQDFQIREQELKLAATRSKRQDLALKLQQAQAELEPSAEKKLDFEKQRIELNRSRQKIADAEERLENEQEKLSDARALVDKGFIATDELRGQIESTNRVEAEVADARLELQIRLIELEKAQMDSDRLRQVQEKIQDLESRIRELEFTLISDEQTLKKLQIGRQERLNDLEKNIIKSPIDGVILSIPVNNGDGVSYDKVLLSLGNPEIEQVQLQLGTLDAVQVEPGQTARVRMIGPSPTEFEGIVKTLDPQAVSPEGSGSFGRGGNTNQARVPAVIQLNRPSEMLIPGSQVSVTIVVQQKEEVIAMQLEAIQQTEAEPFVWLLNQQSQAQKQPVELGLETDIHVEVTKGLSEGDRVILTDPEFPLFEGMTVIPGESSPNGPFSEEVILPAL